MSLELNPQCKERLVEKIAELLPEVIVKNRMFLDFDSSLVFLDAESILPERGPIKDKLNQYIGEAPVYNFLSAKLTQELSDHREYDQDTPTIKLTELEEYSEPFSVAGRLVNEFDSLPWDYTLSIKLGNDFSNLFNRTIKEYELSDEVRIITPYDGFTEKFPLHSIVKPLDNIFNRNYPALLSIFTHGVSGWEEESSYLQIKISGFIGMYSSSAIIDDAIALLTAFCGLGLALRLFKVKLAYQTTPEKAKFIVHRQIDNSWVIDQTHELEISLSQTFFDLTLHDLVGQLTSEEDKISWMKSSLDLIRLVFSNKIRSERIMLGSQWLFDSSSGRNKLLSFIQMTVVLEILLGDKAASDVLGLGELLRNRCAYLISNSHSQRLKIYNNFKNIYNIRSKIVHRGKNRLSFEEKKLSLSLQWMCRRIIQEEVGLLKMDLKEDA